MQKRIESPLVVAFVADLMFTTKIQNVIDGLGYRVTWLGQADEIEGNDAAAIAMPGERLEGRTGHLFELITAWQPALLLFDLANTAVPWSEWIPVLKSSPATRRIPILAFGPHMNVETMEEASEAGADAVLARSRFTADMPALLERYARIPDRDAIVAACSEPLVPLAVTGIEKFNEGQFYACHDDLEEAWRQDSGAARDLYRGILQVAIAYYQIERGNYRGAAKMLLRVRQWLDPLPDICRGVDVAQLRQDATAVHDALVQLGPERITEFDQGLFGQIVLHED
jgi:predicted metal-dependent hydrolase